MRKTLTNMALGVLTIYSLASVFVASPYFNWRYATEHGFASWLCLGEVVATATAAVWPYYAVMSLGGGRDSPDTHTDPHFANSRRASYEALKIISRSGGVTQLARKDESDVIQLLQASVTEAELVEDTYLQQVHPEFQRRFREDYTGSLRSLADGIQTGNQAKLIAAAATYNNFSDWASMQRN